MNNKENNDRYISTEIESAVIQGDKETVQELIVEADSTHRDNKGSTLLHKAAVGESPEVVPMLIDHGVDPDAQDNVGKTALHRALELENYEVAELLLEHGADPNIFDDDGRQPLSDAIMGATSDMKYINMLLEHGADPTLTNNEGISTLDKVQEMGIPPLVERLKSATGDET